MKSHPPNEDARQAAFCLSGFRWTGSEDPNERLAVTELWQGSYVRYRLVYYPPTNQWYCADIPIVRWKTAQEGKRYIEDLILGVENERTRQAPRQGEKAG